MITIIESEQSFAKGPYNFVNPPTNFFPSSFFLFFLLQHHLPVVKGIEHSPFPSFKVMYCVTRLYITYTGT
jgi:hypothetical protein